MTTTWETFYPPRQEYRDGPSAGNGSCSYLRYRVTVEVIDETDDVIRDRLITLANSEKYNHNMLHVLNRLGKNYGFVFGSMGPARIATDDDRAEWAKQAAQSAVYQARREAFENAKRLERNAKAKARRDAKKASKS